MFKHFVFRGVMALVLTLVLAAGAAGIGMLAYNAGVTQGLAASGKLALPQTGAEPGAVAPYVGAPYLGGPFYRMGLWGPGLGLLNCLLLFLGLGFIFTLVRGLIWGRMAWHGPWGRRGWGGQDMPFHGPFGGRANWEKGYPPIVEEWHRKMHGEGDKPTPPTETNQA